MEAPITLSLGLEIFRPVVMDSAAYVRENGVRL
jgi:hypothetical protein